MIQLSPIFAIEKNHVLGNVYVREYRIPSLTVVDGAHPKHYFAPTFSWVIKHTTALTNLMLKIMCVLILNEDS